jgi:hypothetical protein
VKTLQPWRLPRSRFFRDDFPSLGYARVRMRDDCSVVSLTHQFFYARVPKAANSTVMATLEYARSGRAEFTGSDMARLKTGGEQYVRASTLPMTPAQARAALFTFAIVRHPFARAVSAFNDKMLDASRIDGTHAPSRRPFGFDSRPVEELFDEYLALLESPDGLLRNRHHAPQTAVIAFEPRDLDAIGLVERLDVDLPEIMRAIFGRDVPVVTWAPHATDRSARRMRVDLLTLQQKDRLSVIYRDDFDQLPYEPS